MLTLVLHLWYIIGIKKRHLCADGRLVIYEGELWDYLK